MKKAIAILLALMIVLSLAACGAEKPLSPEKLYGIWSGSWVYNDSEIMIYLEFKEDGTYSKDSFFDGLYYDTEEGDYTIDGEQVKLNSNAIASTTVYEYSKGNLLNNDHVISKVE